VEDYMEIKERYDTMLNVVRFSKRLQLPVEVTNEYLEERQHFNKLRVNAEKSIISNALSTNTTSNILKMDDNWCGILFLDDKNNLKFKTEPIPEDSLRFIQRDPSIQGHITRKELEVLLLGLPDSAYLNWYKEQIKEKAVRYLRENGHRVDTDLLTVPKVDIDRCDWPVSPTSHSGENYAIRVLGVDQVSAKKYYRQHSDHIDQTLVDMYNTSEFIWQDDRAEYYVTLQNVILVVSNNSIVTLYPKDLGWGQEIDRTIILMQIAKLSKLREKLFTKEAAVSKDLKEIEENLDTVSADILELQEKLSQAIMYMDSLESTKVELLKGVNIVKQKLETESNKIFKKTKI